MKKVIEIMIATTLLLSLVACGEKTANNNDSSTVKPVENSAPTTSVTEKSSPSGKTASAKDGTLTLSKSDIAVVVNGTSVPMPYKLNELEAAGVPADESRSEIELGVGDFFTANIYLDDEGDYLLIPSYYNDGDSAIKITEAKAEEISMTTYADNPVDQGVSILGVSFGMTREKVKALLGEPMLDEGSYFEWHIEIPDMAYEGTLSLYVTEDSDDAGVSQVNLNVFEK